jgi:hypothetical protein
MCCDTVQDIPVFLTTNLPQPGPLPTTETTLKFANVVANSGPLNYQFYDPATGLFTVPMCGTGIYTITTHIGLNKAGEDVDIDVLIQIKVNGVTISKTDEVIQAGVSKKWYDITIVYPLQVGQVVTVTVTSSVPNVLLVDPLSNFSLVKNVSL